MNGSRREFLVMASAITGGLGGYSGTVTAEAGDRTLVAWEEPTLAQTTTRFNREHPDGVVEMFESDGFGAFLRDEADIQYATRPMTTSERKRARENDIRFEEYEFPLGGIATVASEDGWCRCLSRNDQEALSESRHVEVWSEVTADAPEHTASANLPRQETDILVRGTRAHQYAIGHGGVAYHKVSPLAFGQIDSKRKQLTPVVRLGFAYIDRDAFNRDTVGALLDYQSDAASDVNHIEIAG